MNTPKQATVNHSPSHADPDELRSDSSMPFAARALDPQQVVVQLIHEGVLPAASSPRVTEARLVRHKLGRRCLIEYDVTFRNAASHVERFTLMGKIRARKLDRDAYRMHCALWNEGFNATSDDGISVPEPLGMLPEFQMLLYRRVSGIPFSRLLPLDGAVGLAQRTAEALAKLHRSTIQAERFHGREQELDVLDERLTAVAVERPAWSSRLERLRSELRARAEILPPCEPRLIHRDFYPEHVLIDGPRLYVIDLDLCSGGDPACDVGNFLAHVIESALRWFGRADALQSVCDALLNGYLDLARSELRPAIELATSVALARHIYLSTRFPARRSNTEALLELCEQRCASGRGARRRRSLGSNT